jgi:hypothetical protein
MSKQVESLAQSSDALSVTSVTGLAGNAIADLARDAWGIGGGALGTLALIKHPKDNIIDPVVSFAKAIRHPVNTVKELPDKAVGKGMELFTDGKTLLGKVENWYNKHVPNVEDDGEALAKDGGGAVVDAAKDGEALAEDGGDALKTEGPVLEDVGADVGGALKTAGPVFEDVASIGLDAAEIF